MSFPQGERDPGHPVMRSALTFRYFPKFVSSWQPKYLHLCSLNANCSGSCLKCHTCSLMTGHQVWSISHIGCPDTSCWSALTPSPTPRLGTISRLFMQSSLISPGRGDLCLYSLHQVSVSLQVSTFIYFYVLALWRLWAPQEKGPFLTPFFLPGM